MRIVVIGPTYPFRGGIAHYTTLMVENLRSRHDVLLVSYRKQYPDILYPGQTQTDDSTIAIQTENEQLLSFANPISWRRAARRIIDYQPELVIYTWVSPVISPQFRCISAHLRKAMPSVTNLFLCHNVAQHERRFVDKALTRYAFRYADHFIVHGVHSRRSLLKLLPGAEVTVADHPTYEIFASHTVTREKAREGLGLDGKRPVVLYFGFVRPYKGLMYLLKAMETVAGELPSILLLVVGEFWEKREPYDREIARTGIGENIRVVDRYVANEEVSSYFTAADLVALPYVSASTSGIVQISYGFGKPVLTTDVGDLPSVVEEGRTGYLVPPENPEALAGAILGFFSSGRSVDFERNIVEYRSRFSWERLVKAIEEIRPSGEA